MNTKTIKLSSISSRRTFLKKTTILAASVLYTPLSFSLIQNKIKNFTIKKNFLSEISRLSDIILPKTKSPSATDVNAHFFAINFTSQAKEIHFFTRFHKGFEILIDELESHFNLQFDKLSNKQITSYLNTVLEDKKDSESYWFLFRFRQLLIIGWALSQQIAESAFAYKGGLYQYLPSTQTSQIIMSNYIDKEYLIL